MSWSGTYSHTLAIAADILTASILWNHEDVTVSSLCGLELRRGPAGDPLLSRLGRLLNRIQRNHCEMAIQADIARAKGAIKLLGG